MNRLILLAFFSVLITGCTFVSSEEGAKIRTVEENNAITDSWYPIQSMECQLFVDSFGLVAAAIGDLNSQYLLDNMDQIERNLQSTGEIVSQKLFELSLNTEESSIRTYALEAIPFFDSLKNLISDDTSDVNFQVESLNKMYELTGKVPDACKS